MNSSDLAILSIKQRFKVIEQKLNASIVDRQTNVRKDDLFVNKLIELMKSGYLFHSRLSAEKIASTEFGINDKQFVKELAEYAITKLAREYAKELGFIDAYDKLVELYEIQPYSTHQTNVSIDLNQYSTPIPIGYLLGNFIGLNYSLENKIFFEPTAGNGMLTIAGSPESIIVNEIDRDRLSILKKQGFKDVLNQDALRPFNFDFKFDGIISNPPFGGNTSTMIINGYKISGMDQQIILKSLNYLKNDGKAAFIIGGHTKYDEEGRIKGDKDRAFLSYLAHFYNLVDVINLDGKLYRKQGTSYPIRLIFINGIKEIPNGFFPLNIIGLPYENLFSSEIIDSFDKLLKRYKKIILTKN